MKRLFLAGTSALFAWACLAARVEVPQLPFDAFPDTECETNLVTGVWAPTDRILSLSLAFAATPSNCVQVALGKDADGDGVLSLEETACAFGWECGSWFVIAEGSETVEAASIVSGPKSFSWQVRLDAAGRPVAFEAADGGATVFAGLSRDVPAWIASREWDAMRLTARGADGPDAAFSVSVTPNGTRIVLR